MEWGAEISKEEAERMLTERQREFGKVIRMNLETIRLGEKNGPTKTHLADNNHISDVVFTTINNKDKCLQKISEAWERIRDDTFGICLTCREPIPEKQLRITPERSLCVGCKKSKNKKPRKSFV